MRKKRRNLRPNNLMSNDEIQKLNKNRETQDWIKIKTQMNLGSLSKPMTEDKIEKEKWKKP